MGIEITLPLFAALMFFGFMATEGGVEYLIGTLFDHIAKITPYKWTLKYFSMAAGLGFAFAYNLDIPNIWFGLPALWVGVVATGFVMGRGANAVHDVAKKVSAWLGKLSAK